MVLMSHPKVSAILTDAAGDAVMNGTLSVSGNRTDAMPSALYVSTNGVWQPVFTPSARGDGNDASYMVSVHNYTFNGTTWDRGRGNLDATALASAARTALVNAGNFTNYNGRGVMVFIDVTAWTAGSITVSIQGLDNASAKWNTLATSAALAAVAQTTLTIYPGIAATANVAINGILPRVWRLAVAVGSADSITYSIGYSMIV